MQQRLACLCLWVGAGITFVSPVAADPGAVAVDEWAGKTVMAKTAQVVPHERPDAESPAIAYSLCGVLLTVSRAEQGWLNVHGGWVPLAEVVPVDEAIEFFTAQLGQAESEFAFLGRARGWLERGDDDRAQADVSEALRLAPQSSRAVLVQARIAEEQGRNEAALAGYDRAAQLNPHDPVTFGARVNIWVKRGDYDRAITDLTTAITLLPSDPNLWDQRGWCYDRKGDLDRALSDVGEAIRLDQDSAHAHSLRALLYMRRRQYDQAFADADAAVRLDPTMAHGYAIRGDALAAKDKPDEALRDFDESIRLDAGQAYVYVQRALLRRRQGDFDAALLDFTQAITLNPGDARAYYQRADLWARTGDNASAIIDLGEYLRLKPDAVDAWVARGTLRMQTSGDEALADFAEALRLNPRHLGALLGQAAVWEQQEDHEKALQALTKAIDVGPASADICERRARLRLKRGEHDSAIEDLNVALRLDPKNTDRLLLRALEWTFIGETEKALEDCRTALAIDPKKLMAYYYMALAHKLAGQPDQAIEDFDTALRVDPEDTHMRFLRAYELFNQKKFDLALAGVDEVIRSGKNLHEAYGWRGYFWLLREDWKKAAADYSEALRFKPDDAQLLARRASCWLELNELETALQDAEEALRLDPKSTEAAETRKEALAAKNGQPRRTKREGVVSGPVELSTVVPKTATSPEPAAIAPEYDLEVRLPTGTSIAWEDFPAQQFHAARLPTPLRLPMVGGAIVRLQLLSGKSDTGNELYARIRAEKMSPEHTAILKKAAPRFALTDADFAVARSGTDVVELLVLSNHANEKSSEPATGARFDVLKSGPNLRGDALLAEANRQGIVAAELFLSRSLPPLFDSIARPSNDQFVSFSVSGPAGLMFGDDALIDGRFSGTFRDEPLPTPAHYCLMFGMSLRFQLTGAPRPEAKPLYGLLTVADRWPDELRRPRDTEFPIHFSEADLEAAAAGNDVAHVIYFAKQTAEREHGGMKTLKSASMPPGSDVVAEASRQGSILATVKLSKELPELPLKLAK